MNIDRIWMVYGGNLDQPKVIHRSSEAARIEAQRLAKANPGHVFVILQAVDAWAIPPREVERVTIAGLPV